MFGSNVLEVATGLVFVYSLLSLLCSTVNEWIITRFLALRANTLKSGVQNMLGPDLTEKLYTHPLISGLSKPGPFGKLRGAQQSKPSYIPSRTFALALTHVVSATGAAPVADPKAQTVLAALKSSANGDPQQEQENIAQWFDDTMDRVSGWYKRKVQLIIMILALVVCGCLNLDTFGLINGLSRDTTVRSTIVSAAQGSAQKPLSLDLKQLQQNFQQLQPTVGWSGLPADLPGWIGKIIGLLATTIAVSLGAPFWFDLLSKVVSLRSVGDAPPTASGGQGS